MAGPPNDSSRSDDALDVSDFLRPVLSRWWLILGLVAIVAGGTYAYFDQRPARYRATTRILIQTSELDQLLSGVGTEQSDRAALNQTLLIESRLVANEVARRIGTRRNPADLLRDYKAESTEGADVVTITATASTAAGAARLANTVALSYGATRGQSTQRRARRTLNAARAELASLPQTAANRNRRQELADTIRQVQALAAVPQGNAEQIDSARTPRFPFYPRPRRNAIFAGVLALFLGILGALTLDRMDRRLRRLEDVESAYGLPVLSLVPHARKLMLRGPNGVRVSRDVHEAFRTLRASLRLGSIDSPLRTIAIVSAVPAEGKSTVASNLALTYEESGAHVVVVEADLRKPSLARLFGLEPEPGVTEALLGHQSLIEVAQTVEVDPAGQPVAVAAPVGIGGAQTLAPRSLEVVTSGMLPPNPPSLLAADRFRAALAELAEDRDVVLIDCPPLLAVSDASYLLPYVDGVVLVARVGHTTTDQVRDLIAMLDRVPHARILGVVANDTRSGRQGNYYYASEGRRKR